MDKTTNLKEENNEQSKRSICQRQKGGKEELEMTNSKISAAVPQTRQGLPKEAFAIVGDPEDPDTWKLPHHTKAIFRALKGRIDIEETVDWDRMPAAVAALSRGGYRGERVKASPEEIIRAARHLANHYRAAGKPVPDILNTLI
jgi:hypothetical protein